MSEVPAYTRLEIRESAVNFLKAAKLKSGKVELDKYDFIFLGKIMTIIDKIEVKTDQISNK